MANDKLTISTRELFRLFPDAESARKYIETRVWPNGPVCPRCSGNEKITARKNGFYRCNPCKKDFSVRAGTIFEHSKVALDKWVHAMYLLLTARKGISSMQLSKELSVTQATAWFILMRLREACGADMEALNGIVEVDECFVGGIEKNRHASNRKLNGQRGSVDKVAVIGLRERGTGRVKAMPLPEVNRYTMQKVIIENVQPGSTIHTDENTGYQKMDVRYKHESICHSNGEYHKDGVGTNSIESVWALLKRGLHGVYHHASEKHLARYVNEFAFRLNAGNVKEHVLIRLNALVDSTVGKRLSYAELIA